MKVKVWVDHYQLSSNAVVEVIDVKDGRKMLIKEVDIRCGLPDWMASMRVNSFRVCNNIVTLYIE